MNTIDVNICYQAIDTPFGTIWVAAQGASLIASSFPPCWEDKFRTELHHRVGADIPFCHEKTDALVKAAEWLQVFFSGSDPGTPPPLNPQGTPFQVAVWDCLLAIPWGEVRSYGEVAATVGKPNAARAVGTACGANPLAPFIPCHRIVTSDGKLGGFGGGLPMKRKLLANENTVLVSD